MKAAYAFGFLALCAVVLVVHVYDNQEQVKEVDSEMTYNDDPFLATLERVIAAAPTT